MVKGARAVKPFKRKSVSASRLKRPHRYATVTYDGRKRVPPVKSLQEFMRAYGRGEEAQARRAAFITRTGTSYAYVMQIAVGLRGCGVEMAISIERASYGQVRCEHLAPAVDWEYLAQRKVVRPVKPLRRKRTARGVVSDGVSANA